MNKKFLTLKFLFIFTWVLTSVMDNTHSYSLSFKGEITRTMYRPNSKTIDLRNKFTVLVSDCDWKMEIIPIIKESQPDNLYKYYLENHEEGVRRVENYRKDDNQDYSDYSVEHIEPGILPSPFIDMASILWLAYCSKCYFESDYNNQVPQVWYYASNSNWHLDQPKKESIIEFLNNSFKLPKNNKLSNRWHLLCVFPKRTKDYY